MLCFSMFDNSGFEVPSFKSARYSLFSIIFQARQKQIKSERAEKIHFCLPYVRYIRFIVNTYGYLKTNKKTSTINSN